ncbi:MAG: META domain-containing protein [Patescibacteria group bacterium]
MTYSDESVFDLTLKNDIYSACALGLMYGQDGRFSPLRTLSRAEALAIIMRAVDGGKKDESGTVWYSVYADRAHELSIISSVSLSGFDAAITRGELIEWIYLANKYLEKKNADSPLIGSWTLTKYNDTVITSTGYTLVIGANSIAAKFCNNMSGSYSVSLGKFVAPTLMSTMMYCE